MAKRQKRVTEELAEKKSRVTTGKGIKMEIKGEPDLVYEVMNECRTEDGKVDPDALVALARANHLDKQMDKVEANGGYKNPGMYRMNIGNMLRGAMRRRGGLNDASGKFRSDPNHEGEVTENRDGTKIAKAKPVKEKPEAEESSDGS